MKNVRRLVAMLALLSLIGWGAYRWADPETNEITPTVRQLVGGRFIQLTDGFTHYQLTGPEDAETVVLAAGSSVPYYIWYPTFKMLVDSGFRVLRYDYYGRGYSDRPNISYNEALYVRQLDELLDSLQITTPINLAGLSFGGSVITSFADRYPDRVKRLIYVDPAIRRVREVSTALKMPVVRNVAMLLRERGAAEGQLSDFLHPTRFPDWAERYRPQMKYRGFRSGRLADAVDVANLDQQPELDRLSRSNRPVLIIWGKQDSTVPITRSAQLLKAFPNAEFVAVDSSGHLPHWENPRAVHPALLAFLRK